MLCFFIPKKALQSLRPNVDEGFRNNVLKILFLHYSIPRNQCPAAPRTHTAVSARAQRDHRSMLQAPSHAIP